MVRATSELKRKVPELEAVKCNLVVRVDLGGRHVGRESRGRLEAERRGCQKKR